MEHRERLSRVLQSSSDRAHNPDEDGMRELIRRVETIAVVGMSRDPMKPARRIPSYLAAMGAHIIPINPVAGRMVGKPARKSLEDVTEPVDMVFVFRPSAQVAPFVRAAAARPEKPVIWLPEGVRDDESASEARAAGLTVVQDLCIYRVHRALGGTLRRAFKRSY
ncbi:MAG: CoA-binding protein [Gemmatimonadetes bacterium]|nr:CoA-binding protein [Gemmatimonadota bacterium]